MDCGIGEGPQKLNFKSQRKGTINDHVFVSFITGKSETFVVETARHEELGDTIFIECMDDSGVTRLALPPKVANAIAAQRDALTSRRRSRAAKAVQKARKDRGELPGFMKNKRS